MNRTDRTIDSLHVLSSADVETRAMTFDRATRMVTDDSVRLYRIYALEQSLAPGDSIAMTFELSHRPRGFRNDGAPPTWHPMGRTSKGLVADAGLQGRTRSDR